MFSIFPEKPRYAHVSMVVGVDQFEITNEYDSANETIKPMDDHPNNNENLICMSLCSSVDISASILLIS